MPASEYRGFVGTIAMKNLSIVLFVLFVAYLADNQFFHGQYRGAVTGVSKQVVASFGLSR